jgi:PIN domain nuclease of toxin-antitoxin system
MKYLLDTHIILWIAFNDNKLSRKTKDIFTSKAIDIYISSISLWEISIKYFSGKLDLKDYTPETLMAGFDLYFDYQKLDLAFDDAMTFHV